jgi:hypothetical protein
MSCERECLVAQSGTTHFWELKIKPIFMDLQASAML